MDKKDNGLCELRFTYKNLYQDSTTLEQKFDDVQLEMTTEYNMLVNEFMNFLMCCGFSRDTVNTRISNEMSEV